MGGACGTYEEMRCAYKVFVGKPEGKNHWEDTGIRHLDIILQWEDNIKMDLHEVGWGSMDWIELAQDRDRRRTPVNVVMNLRVP